MFFSTSSSGTIASVHGSRGIQELRGCGALAGGAARSGGYVFVAQPRKALLHVYGAEVQRLPLPEALQCIQVIRNSLRDVPAFLLGGTSTGKLYVWDLASGALLSAKNAHYQGIVRIVPFDSGRYVATAAEDARVMLWETRELVSSPDPKPCMSLHDHTLPITDIKLSTGNAARLFTASQDGTVRCYSLEYQGGLHAFPIATFASPFRITALELDPADRALYIIGPEGVHILELLYPTVSGRLNVLQNGGVYSLVVPEMSDQDSSTPALAPGQLATRPLLQATGTCAQLSLDGSLLLVGLEHGSVQVIEVASAQVLRTLATPGRSDTVTNIQMSVSAPSPTASQVSFKFPSLQRSIHTRTKHELWAKLPSTKPTQLPFEDYINQIRIESIELQQEQLINPLSKTLSTTETTPKDEVSKLQDDVTRLTTAYKELRELHDSLYSQHTKLLEQRQ